MNPYQAPLADMRFLLEQVFDAPNTWAQLPDIAEMVDMDTASAILEEAAKISAELIHPLNRAGDEQGVLHQDNRVITPDGYKAVYDQYSKAAGWAYVVNPSSVVWACRKCWGC